MEWFSSETFQITGFSSAGSVQYVICPHFPPSRRTSPIVYTSPWIFPTYAGTGLRRRLSIRPKIFWNKLLGTATSANWNVTYRSWRTSLAPILTSFSRSVVSHQRSVRARGVNFCSWPRLLKSPLRGSDGRDSLLERRGLRHWRCSFSWISSTHPEYPPLTRLTQTSVHHRLPASPEQILDCGLLYDRSTDSGLINRMIPGPHPANYEVIDTGNLLVATIAPLKIKNEVPGKFNVTGV